MKSTIRIALDEQNQPVIKIDYKESDDVRDDLLKRWRHGLGFDSSWAKVHIYDKDGTKLLFISPVHDVKLSEEANDMLSIVRSREVEYEAPLAQALQGKVDLLLAIINNLIEPGYNLVYREERNDLVKLFLMAGPKEMLRIDMILTEGISDDGKWEYVHRSITAFVSGIVMTGIREKTKR